MNLVDYMGIEPIEKTLPEFPIPLLVVAHNLVEIWRVELQRLDCKSNQRTRRVYPHKKWQRFKLSY